MLKKINIILLLIVLSAGSGFGQDEALKSLLQTALQNNYGIRLARVDQEMAENQNTLGNAGFAPRVFLDGDYQQSIRESEQEFVSGDRQEVSGGRSANLGASIGVEWTVFDGFKMFAERDKLQSEALRSKTNTRYYVEQTVQDLVLVYYQLMQGREMLEELRMVYEISQERYTLEERRNEVGSGSALELYRAQINLNADSMQLVKYKADLRNFELEINRLIGTDLQNEIATGADFNTNPGLDTEAMFEEVLTKNSDLSLVQLQQLIEEQNVKSQRGNLMPEVMLFGSYSFNRSTSDFGFLLSNRQFGPQLGVNLRFNLYDGGRERTAMQNAKLQAESAQISVEEKKNEISAAYYIALENFNSAKQQLALSTMNAEQAEKLKKIAIEQYKNGVITSLEFRQVQLEVLQAKIQVIESEYALKQNEIRMYRLTGTILDRLL